MNKFKIRISFWARMQYKAKQRRMYGYKKPYVSVKEGERWQRLAEFCEWRMKYAEYEYLCTGRFSK